MLVAKKDKIMWDDKKKMVSEEKMLENFLNKSLGKKRLLVIRVTTGKEEIYTILKDFAKSKELGMTILNKEKLDIDYINELKSKKDKPQMVIIDHLEQVKKLETIDEATLLRGIIDQIDPENEHTVLHKDSFFVFLAVEGFPSQELMSLSLTWAHESAFIDCRDFRTKIITHMEEYKKKTLNLNGLVAIKHRKYGHILRERDYEYNFSSQVSDKLVNSKFLKPIKWNRFSHHLNSSQVMTVNFFYPLIRYRELEAFLAMTGIEDEIIYDPEHLQFLKVCEEEKSGEKKTYFDFYMKLKSGRKVYVEAKYTEGVYGKSNSKSHLTKYNEVFEPLLKDSILIKDEFKTEEFFLEHYNFMRGLAHMKKDTYLVVLYPRENWALRERALYIKDNIIESTYREQYIPMVWEEMLEGLIKGIKDNNVAWYYEGWFKDKYFRY